VTALPLVALAGAATPHGDNQQFVRTDGALPRTRYDKSSRKPQHRV